MKRGQWVLVATGVLWMCVVGTGLGIMLNYETAPGIATTPPKQWPSHSQIRRDLGRPTLVMLAHPHCPCTRASIGELAVLMARLQGRVSACVLFSRPRGFSEDWEKTDLWRTAAAIPGVTVLRDDGGVEAARFHAAVSGQTLLYDANGRLLFSGGITASRAYSGDNKGRSAIISLVMTGVAEQTQTSVFGCSLHDPDGKALQAGRSWTK